MKNYIVSRISVNCFVKNKNGQFLLVRQARPEHAKGKWSVPGGKIMKNEDFKRAVVREVKEETGLDITFDSHTLEPFIFEGDKNDSVLGYSPFYISQQIKGGRAYINLGFICDTKEVDSPLKENKYETKDPHWVTVDKLEQMLKTDSSQFFPLNVPVLQKYIEYKKNG